ncbi:MAG: hypothetical protein IJM15_01975 [Erysipelotrichaceae bacterium]|nr:hypothetical protein [Erysipelotrichaceae bacterium]
MAEIISNVYDFLINNGFYITAGAAAFDFLMFLILSLIAGKRKSGMARLMAFFALGMALESATHLAGSLFTAGETLFWVNKGRYMLHGLLMALFLPIATYAMDPITKGKVLIWLITLPLIAGGVFVGYMLQLEPVQMAYMLRYVISDETIAWVKIAYHVICIWGIIPLLLCGLYIKNREKNISLIFIAVFMVLFAVIGPVLKFYDVNFLIMQLGYAVTMLLFVIAALTIEVSEE